MKKKHSQKHVNAPLTDREMEYIAALVQLKKKGVLSVNGLRVNEAIRLMQGGSK